MFKFVFSPSGIVAVLFCGLSQARYTVLNLSAEGRSRTKQVSVFTLFISTLLTPFCVLSLCPYVCRTFPWLCWQITLIHKKLIYYSSFTAYFWKKTFSMIIDYQLMGINWIWQIAFCSTFMISTCRSRERTWKHFSFVTVLHIFGYYEKKNSFIWFPIKT